MSTISLAWRTSWRIVWLSLVIALVVVWVETQLDERTASPLLPVGHLGLALPLLVGELLFAVFLVRNRERWSESNAWQVRRFFCQLGFVFCCVLLCELLWDSIFLPIYEALGLHRFTYLFVPGLLLAVVFLIVTSATFWRWPVVQRLVVEFVRLYLQYDPCGYQYYRIRRMKYWLTHRSTPALRFVSVLKSLTTSEAARLSHDLQSGEIHTRNRLAALPEEVTISFDPAATLDLARRLSQHRQALAQHLAPDYAGDTTSVPDRITAAHLWLKNWLMACHLNRLVDSVALDVTLFRQQALVACKRLQVSQPAAPERSLIDFLIMALQSSSPPSMPLDLVLLQAAETSLLSLGRVSSKDPLEPTWIRLSLEIWLEYLACRQDFQAVIHFGTRFVQSPFGQAAFLAHITYQHLGYAWWDCARQISETGYRHLAWRQAMHSFMQGHCLQPLELLVLP